MIMSTALTTADDDDDDDDNDDDDDDDDNDDDNDDDDDDNDDGDGDRGRWGGSVVRDFFYLSGTCLERSVPIEGKYIPTQASNTKKPASTAAMEDPNAVAIAIDDAAETSIPEVMSSIDTPRLIRLLRGKRKGGLGW
jgi:hypothetical protein